MSGDLYFQLGEPWIYIKPLELWPDEIIEKHFPSEASEALAEDWRLHGEATHISADGSRWYGDGVEGIRTHIASKKSDKLFI